MEEISINEVINEIKKIKEEYQNENDEERIAELKNLNTQIAKGLKEIKDEKTRKIIENLLIFFNIQYTNLNIKYIRAKNDLIDSYDTFIDTFENVKNDINNALYQNFRIKLDFDLKDSK